MRDSCGMGWAVMLTLALGFASLLWVIYDETTLDQVMAKSYACTRAAR